MFFIAEIGGNHQGDMAYARALNDLAIGSGADAVKHQIYTGDTLVSEVVSPARNAHFRSFELGEEGYLELADRCDAGGVEFMASTWDLAMVPWVDRRVRIHKVGSGDLTCYPMLRRLAQTGKPLILSTGLSTLDEVGAAVEFIAGVDASYVADRKLALLQCTSSYPCPDEDVNLDAMVALRDRFGLPVGYSDHTTGTLAIEVAVSMGASIIESHFTDRRDGQEFRDHKVSLTQDEVHALLERLRTIRRLKGEPVKRPTPAEVEQDHVTSFRRSLYAGRDIASGEELTEENLTALRPDVGISAVHYDQVLGRRTSRALQRHELVQEGDLV